MQTDDRLDALNELQAKLEEYGMLDDVTRMEFADTDQMAFLYQDRVSVLLGTRNDLDYKLDRARYVLTNADGKGCAPTDTGRLDFSHVSAGSTRKIYFAQGQPTLPSGYVVPEKTVPEEPDTSAAELNRFIYSINSSGRCRGCRCGSACGRYGGSCGRNTADRARPHDRK